MVDRKKVKRMIPNLLTNGNTSNRKHMLEYQKIRYKWSRVPSTKKEPILLDVEQVLKRLERMLEL